jgi:probable rRNA maturation factor
MIDVAVQREEPWPAEIDWDALAERGARAGVERTPQGTWLDSPALVEIAVRLTSDEEVRALNRDYRGKDAATNVLSFPMIQSDLIDAVTQNSDDGEVLLGDVVLAYGVCMREAAEKSVELADHVTHLIVHGVLHLLGHDHGDDAAARAMESIERDALASLGIADPYHDED